MGRTDPLKAIIAKEYPVNARKNAANGISDLIKELWQAAVNLRGSIEPADYKRWIGPNHTGRMLKQESGRL